MKRNGVVQFGPIFSLFNSEGEAVPLSYEVSVEQAVDQLGFRVRALGFIPSALPGGLSGKTEPIRLH